MIKQFSFDKPTAVREVWKLMSTTVPLVIFDAWFISATEQGREKELALYLSFLGFAVASLTPGKPKRTFGLTNAQSMLKISQDQRLEIHKYVMMKYLSSCTGLTAYNQLPYHTTVSWQTTTEEFGIAPMYSSVLFPYSMLIIPVSKEQPNPTKPFNVDALQNVVLTMAKTDVIMPAVVRNYLTKSDVDI